MPILAATSNQQLMFSSESWAGECGGSWPHCLKSNVTELRSPKVSWQIQAASLEDSWHTVVRKMLAATDRPT